MEMLAYGIVGGAIVLVAYGSLRYFLDEIEKHYN